ncbi:unnamed protein product [Allacma fusca]|uniref:5'-nucleotidase domain-containing protein 3 n=1 Tax=Allacma fusca TaxID=39272 RepID=A0A8J2L2J5_9HEXA|nr:unnamed protein product [Allacma fusca]
MHSLSKSRLIPKDLFRSSKSLGGSHFELLVVRRGLQLSGVELSGPNPIINSINRRNRYHNKIVGSDTANSKVTEDLKPREQLKKAYEDALTYCRSKKLPEDVDPQAVFACNRLNLRDVDVFGFDYDYTLACYRPELEQLIYDLGRQVLINSFKYPREIEDLDYNRNFAVRGLHYDIQKGLLLKVDSFMQIQLGCVYRGLTQLPDDEVLAMYGSRKIPVNYIEAPVRNKNESPNMVQLADLFSLPEMNLLCNVTEFLHNNGIDFCPESLFRDIKDSVQSIHPTMHQIVSKQPENYLDIDPLLREYLSVLKDAGKKLFLITNSPYHFVDRGLCYILGEDWTDFFDVTIVSARKPHFFSAERTPFRLYDPHIDARLWDRVTSFEPGKIYYGGNVKQFQAITGWKGEKVLYFGDHPYTDLADVTLHHGWRTGAIIRELAHEIETLNSPDFKYTMNWLQFMTSLLESYQDLDDASCDDVIREWQQERNKIRKSTKRIFNNQFGSMFRTHMNPTFFSKRLFRFADIYTSSVTNLLKYSVRHTFYPRRGALPHEYRSWFN